MYQNSYFTYITKQIFLVNTLMVGGGCAMVILLFLKNVNNTLSAADTSDKHNNLDIKVYLEGRKGAA